MVQVKTTYLIPLAVLAFLSKNTAGENFDQRDGVVAGYNATLDQFPYYASLRANGEHICGGSILNDRWILTAAHCIVVTNYDVKVGSIHLEQGEKYKLSKIIVHGRFNLTDNDIALLKTEKPIHFNNNVQPIKLHSAYVTANERVVTSGFGATDSSNKKPSDVLKALDLQTLSQQKCSAISSVITTDLLCAVPGRGQGLCEGDSGGPLILDGELVGVTLWTSRYHCGNVPYEVFTRVSSYVDWINKEMEL